MNTTALYNQYTQNIPVDIYGFAQDLGLTVVERDLDNDISGGLSRLSIGFELFVNAKHTETRKRFTVGHEIGHFLLHKDLIGNGVDDNTAYRRTGSERFNCARIGYAEEAQANQFAAELLMPSRQIRLAFKSIKSVHGLAAQFNVSEQTMKIRLSQLGLT
jgi:Zn-dependent peptidase ImmA (M78 family)